MASSKTQTDSTWVTPATWSTGELVTASDLNAELRDQLSALKVPASAYGVVDEASDYTIASSTWADVDATNLAMTVVSTVDCVMHVEFNVTIFYSSGSGDGITCFDIDVNGTRYAGDDGLKQGFVKSGLNPQLQSLTIAADIPVSAGSNTFKLQWMRYTTISVTVGMYAGAGTSQHDVHPVMSCREVA